MSKIQRFQGRLESISFRRTFAEKSSECARDIARINGGSSALSSAVMFRQVLELILAVGNYLNTGFRGGAYGFKIDALLKVRPAVVPSPPPPLEPGLSGSRLRKDPAGHGARQTS